MLKSKDVDTRFKALKKQKEDLVKLSDNIERGWSKVVEASDTLYNELAEIETHKEFGAAEKKVYEREIKDWINTTDAWGTWLSALDDLTEKMNKAYVNLHK